MVFFFFFFVFFFRKIKQFHSSKVSFQKRFSSSDHLNVITTNINICFDYILAKSKRKNGHHIPTLRLRAVPADIGKISLKLLTNVKHHQTTCRIKKKVTLVKLLLELGPFEYSRY